MQRLSVVCLLFLSSLLSVNAQEVDSLNNIIANLAPDTEISEKIDLFISLGEAYYHAYEYENAAKTYSQALRLNQLKKDPQVYFQLYSNLGYMYFWLDDYEKALEYLRLAKGNLSYSPAPEETAQYYNRLAEVYINLGNYETALQYQLRGLAISDSIEARAEIAYSYKVLSTIYWYTNHLDESLRYNKLALTIFKELGNNRRYYSSLAAQATVLIELEDYDEAKKFAERSLVYADSISYPYGIAFSTGLLGELARKLGKYEEATPQIQKAIQLFKELEIKFEGLDFTKSLAQTYAGQGDYRKAINLLKESLPDARQVKANPITKEIYGLLSGYHYNLGQFGQAYDYLNMHLTLKDSLLNAENQKRMSNMRLDYEVQKRENEIKYIRQSAELERKNIILYSLIIGSLLLVAIAWLLYIRYITLRQNSEVLARKNKEIQFQNEQLSSSNADLHQFAHVLSSELQKPIHGLQTEVINLEGKLGEAQQSYHEPLESIRLQMERMENVVIGLWEFSALGGEEKDYSHFAFSEVVSDAIRALPDDFRKQAARISLQNLPIVQANRSKIQQLLQNLISNAIRYQSDRPLEITISCVEADHEYLFSIKDNGVGIPPDKHHEVFTIFGSRQETGQQPMNLGLAVSRKIIEQHHGHIWVESSVDEGSTFYFTLPVSYP